MSWHVDISARVGELELNVQLEAPQSAVIIGANGAGKTTLFRALIGALPGCSGTAKLVGRELLDRPIERRGIGYVPQRSALFPHLNVRNNVAFGLGHLTRPARDARVQELLEELSIDHLANRRPYGLSGGEAQRVALARALAPSPAGLVLDEPLAALDVSSRAELRALIAAYSVKIPTLLTSHDVRDARRMAGPIVVLQAGRVLQAGSVAELSAAPGSDFVAEFFDVF